MLGVTVQEFIFALADALAERLAERDESLIDQRDRRGLMGRRHIDAVRRRIAEGRKDSFIRKRDYLMTPAALRDELVRYAVSDNGDGVAGAGDADERSSVRLPRPSKNKSKAAERAERERVRQELAAEASKARRGKA
jgi:hypothetical protein